MEDHRGITDDSTDNLTTLGLTPVARSLIHCLVDSGDEVGLSILDKDDHIVWMNTFHARQLREWTGYNYHDVRDRKCHQVWNDFRDACTWCPVVLTRKDGRLHLGRAASPPRHEIGSLPVLKYSYIASVPLTSSASAHELILEMVFPDERVAQQYAQLLETITPADAVGRLLANVNNQQLFADLLVLGMLAAVNQITATRAYRYENDSTSPTDREPLFASYRESSREKLSAALATDTFSALLANPGELYKAWGATFTARKISKRQTASEVVGETHWALLASDWTPMRIGANAFAVRFPCPFVHQNSRAFWLIVAENTAPNTFMLQEALVQAGLYLSSVRRHMDLMVTQKREMNTRKSFEQSIQMLKHPAIVDIVPFAIGLTHDIGNLIKRQRNALHTLRHLEIGTKAHQLMLPELAIIEATTDLLATMQAGLLFATFVEHLDTYKSLQPIRIRELLDRTLAYAVDPKRRKFDVVRRYLEGPDVLTNADPSLLEQVFFNIIDNAGKAMARVTHRRPELQIRVRQSTDHTDIVFKDNGEGITAADQKDIFNKFFSRTGGTGLGLYFSQLIVQKVHKGSIFVESSWGFWTEFTIRLPR